MEFEFDDDDDDDTTTTSVNEERNRGGRKQMKMGTTRRNARERNRVRHINTCFELLRQHIPQHHQQQQQQQQQHQKKLSKVDTLKSAMIYIENLRQLLENSSSSSPHCSQSTAYRYPVDVKQEHFAFWSSSNQDQHQHHID